MPIEHISCDEYVSPPDGYFYFNDSALRRSDSKNESLKREKDEKVSDVKLKRKKKEDLKIGSYNDYIDADNHISGYQCIRTASVAPQISVSSGFSPSLLKEAISDAKAVRETALLNAKAAMDEAFKNNFHEDLDEAFNKQEKIDQLNKTNDEIRKQKIDMAEQERMKKVEEIDRVNQAAFKKNRELMLKLGDEDKWNIDDALRKRRVKVYDGEKW